MTYRISTDPMGCQAPFPIPVRPRDRPVFGIFATLLLRFCNTSGEAGANHAVFPLISGFWPFAGSDRESIMPP